MVKSRYTEQFKDGLALLSKLHDGEVGRLERSSSEDRLPILESWEDLAGSERMVKETHQGRYLFELIQNANDAIVDAGADANRLARTDHRVRIELSEHSLLVANFGKPFDESNVRALRRLHKTTKRIGTLEEESGQLSRSKRIGHKGIGFKSVLEITSRPEVYSDIYAFGFDANEFYRDVARHIADAEKWSLPIFRVPYPRNINKLPKFDRDRIEQLFDDGFATVIRLPLDDKDLVQAITHRIEEDVQAELLLFMTAISCIEVRFADGRELAYERDVGSLGDTGFDMVRLHRRDATGDSIDSCWLILQAQRRLDDRSLVSGLGDAWKDIEVLGFALAFPLRHDDTRLNLDSETRESKQTNVASQPFHVYYPTREYSGLAFKIHADFYVGDDRQSIPPDKPINHWLINEICDFLSGEALDCLKRQWSYRAELVHRLLPIAQPEGAFARVFLDTYLTMLRVTPFVPIPGQNYRAPENVRLPPREVNQQQFRQLFPPSRLRATANWTYPTNEVTEQEIKREQYREQHSDVPRLLLRSELGAGYVSLDLIIAALQSEGLPPIDEAAEIIVLLADWYAELPGPERREFLERLRSLPIFPTITGWSVPGTTLVFQANIRAEIDEDTVPPGFNFSVIRRSVYPSERGATASNQYMLFSVLGAREYSRRSLIIEAILPVLTNEQRFSELLNAYPDSIFQAYRLLRDYFEEGGTTRDFEQRLGRVPVPDTQHTGWRAAEDCYFGASWPDQNGTLLQRIYEDFSDCFFLPDIPQLGLEDPEDRQRWSAFFHWLGVADRPKMLESNRRVVRNDPSPLPNAPCWAEYMHVHDDDFRCPNLVAHHGYSRGLLSVHAIHHFNELVHQGNTQKLLDLFVLIGRHWEAHYKTMSRTTIACNRVTCPRDQIDDYFLFELQCSRWLPAQISDTWITPLSPRQIWFLSETDPQDVRALVPTLPATLRPSEYRDFITALRFASSGAASIEDYVQLLRLLPERYPVIPPDLPESEHRRWQRSLAAVFNWICERIQTGLVSRGDTLPDSPTDLQLLAYQGDSPAYVSLGSPELVYANDNFLAERWSDRCMFLRINDDWRTLLDWLHVPDLTTVIQSEWQLLGELIEESQQLQAIFDTTLPYFLALIKHTQPANYDRLIPRLLRLNLHVVKKLSTTEWLLPVSEAEPIISEVEVHLATREEPNPGAGRRSVIAGDLYIAKDAATNLDLLGNYIANYIEIARLADAFVILVNRPSEQARWRYLKSKGVPKDTLAGVLSDIQTRTGVTDQTGGGSQVIADIVKRIAALEDTPQITPTPAGSNVSVIANGGTSDENVDTKVDMEERVERRPIPDYPALDLYDLPGVQAAALLEDDNDQDGSVQKKGRGNGGGGPGHIPRQEVTEALGKRGEAWAYENERQRLLIEYGYDPDELEELEELVWVSRREPAANYDIRSIWISESGEQRSLYIEVKSSASNNRQIRMSRQEFRLAMKLGQDYWLYWVANIDEARPDVPVAYKNVAKLVAEERLIIDVDTLALTLPPTKALP